jgi:hypothetical protein
MQDIFKLFDEYNKKYFFNQLPFVDIFIEEETEGNCWGWFDSCHDDTSEPCIIIRADLREEYLEDTILHEMIHLWQYVKCYPVDHGTSFLRQIRRIKRISGVDVT